MLRTISVQPLLHRRWEPSRISISGKLPDRFRMGQASPEMLYPVQDVSKVQDAISGLWNSLNSKYEALRSQMRTLSGYPNTPMAQGIEGLSVPESLGAIGITGKELSKLTDEVLTGHLSGYLLPDQKKALEGLKSSFASLEQEAIQNGGISIREGNEKAADAFVVAQVDPLKAERDNAERAMVSVEQTTVPVHEPEEKIFTQATGVLVGVVALGVVIGAIYLFAD